MGNIIFKKSARNFNSDCAMAAKVSIVEVEEIVDTTFSPEEIHLPHIYVHRVVKGEGYVKPVERTTVLNKKGQIKMPWTGERAKKREKIARRAANEITSGTYVNVGVGIPTLSINFLEEE